MANYRITELDFDSIKQNLKDFLINYRDKDNNLIFSDFDFDASSLSILLDILAYNTHYNAYLSSMVANEMFLDSAVKRESAVSIAKHLGYTPLSFRSSRAVLDFTVTNPIGSPSNLALPRYTRFNTVIEGRTYSFVNLDTVIIKPENGVYRFTDVTVVEGEPLSFTYRVDVGGPGEKYSIPNRNIDTSTIRVRVQNSYTDLTFSTYEIANSLTSLKPDSKVFFLEENTNGFYEIFFGDGSLGQKLKSGNLVIVEYLISSGSLTNVSSQIDQIFSVGSQIGGVNVSPILAKSNSTGGDEPDTIEEIKFKAPKYLSSYDRAVTASDYKAIIEANFPLVESVAVWGGEDNDPPVYGKVLISLKPYTGYTINDEIKNSLLNVVLNDKRMISSKIEFVDPNYIYIQTNTSVRYDKRNSKYTANQIQVLVDNTVRNYFSRELQKFNKDFIYSKLSSSIDSSDTSIIGNVSELKLQKRITPVLNALNGYTNSQAIKFVNSLVSGSIHSTVFFYLDNNNILKTSYISDVLTSDPIGKLRLLDFNSDAVILDSLGTVNYSTGEITIPEFIPAGYLENSNDIRIYAKTENLDIFSTKDVILILDDTLLDVQLGRESGFTITVTE